jgi:hypothetical protein
LWDFVSAEASTDPGHLAPGIVHFIVKPLSTIWSQGGSCIDSAVLDQETTVGISWWKVNLGPVVVSCFCVAAVVAASIGKAARGSRKYILCGGLLIREGQY